MARQRVYITQSVYSSTLFTGYIAVVRASRKESKISELGLSNAARGLVYNRASNDNVHVALNLLLLPPSSREPGRGGSLFHPSFLPLHYIIFHSFRRTFPSVASQLRSALFALFRFYSFFPFLLLRLCRPSISFTVSLLLLYACRCPFLDAEKVRV